MHWAVIIIIVVLIAIIVCKYESFATEINTNKHCIDGGCYKVHNKYENKEDSAKLLQQIDEHNKRFINCMYDRYVLSPEKARREMDSADFDFRKKLADNLKKRYNSDAIHEHVPRSTRNTSFVYGKGENIGYCLREKNSGNDNIHSFDTLQFVNLHELSHLADPNYNTGHDRNFWRIFKILLHEAKKCNIYQPKDYKLEPMDYCGLTVKYNPYFDPHL